MYTNCGSPEREVTIRNYNAVVNIQMDWMNINNGRNGK